MYCWVVTVEAWPVVGWVFLGVSGVCFLVSVEWGKYK